MEKITSLQNPLVKKALSLREARERRALGMTIIDGMRVVVAAPGAAGRDFATRMADQLRGAGHREPLIVGALADAYQLLELDNPQFERFE